MKIGWRPLQVHNICNIWNNICNKNNKLHKVCRLLNYKWGEWRHNLLLKSSNRWNYRYHLVSQNLHKDSHLNLNQGEEWCRSWGSSIKGSKDPTTLINIPKFVEEVAIKTMKVDRVAKLFQTMAIVSLNMGNSNLEVNILQNKLVKREKEKVVLQEELDKERYFHKGYKQNVEIWRKNESKLSRKIKCSLRNYRMRMKSSRVTHYG